MSKKKISYQQERIMIYILAAFDKANDKDHLVTRKTFTSMSIFLSVGFKRVCAMQI